MATGCPHVLRSAPRRPEMLRTVSDRAGGRRTCLHSRAGYGGRVSFPDHREVTNTNTTEAVQISKSLSPPPPPPAQHTHRFYGDVRCGAKAALDSAPRLGAPTTFPVNWRCDTRTFTRPPDLQAPSSLPVGEARLPAAPALLGAEPSVRPCSGRWPATDMECPYAMPSQASGEDVFFSLSRHGFRARG